MAKESKISNTSTPLLVQTEMTTSHPLNKEGNKTICLLAFLNTYKRKNILINSSFICMFYLISSYLDNLASFGGFNYDNGKIGLEDVELISLSPHEILKCRIPDLPEPLYGHSTVKTKIGIINCGGFNQKSLWHNSCYKLTPNSSWEPFPTMKQKRMEFALAEGNGILFANGGSRGSDDKSTMEWINLDYGTRWTLENTPFSVHNHCMTKFNRTHLILTGGILNNEVTQ